MRQAGVDEIVFVENSAVLDLVFKLQKDAILDELGLEE